MKDAATKDRFVELRAQGKSFAAIAEELSVSKPTLIEWSRDLRVQIANLRAVNDEALRERYRLTKEHQLQALSHQLEIIQTEIDKRGLTDIPTDKLYGILFKLAGELREHEKPITFQHVGLTMYDIEQTSTWEA